MIKIILLLLIIIFCIIIGSIIKKNNKENYNNLKDNDFKDNDLLIHVMHYTPLKERYKFMKKQLDNLSCENRFVTKYDKEKLSKKDLKLFNTDKVKLSECSLAKKHIDTYINISKNKYKYNLILEDDAILSKDFYNILKKGLKELPDDYDMLFIGTCLNLHAVPEDEIKSDKLIYVKSIECTSDGGGGGTKCTDSYLVSKKCAKKLKKYISTLKDNDIDEPADFWLNKVIRDLKLKIYWMEPGIVKQGTETGYYKSSIAIRS